MQWSLVNYPKPNQDQELCENMFACAKFVDVEEMIDDDISDTSTEC